jgi:hypothetical protein
MNQEVIRNKQVYNNEIEAVIKNNPTKKNPRF